MLRLALAVCASLLFAVSTADAQDDLTPPPPPPGYDQPQQQPPPQQPPPAGYQQPPPQQQQGYPQQGYGQASYPTGAYAPQPPAPPPPRPPPPDNTLTFNPLALLIGFLNIEFEHAFADGVSFYLGPQLLLFNPFELFDPDIEITAYGGAAGIRFFPGGRAPVGFFIGPDVQVVYVEVTNTATDVSAEAVGWALHAMFGQTWNWSGFVLSIGGGFGYQQLEADGEGVKGVSYAFRGSIGFAF